MWELTYPILIIVVSNTLYNLCAKSTPQGINSFASLTVTYLVAAAVSFTVFILTNQGKNIITSVWRGKGFGELDGTRENQQGFLHR